MFYFSQNINYVPALKQFNIWAFFSIRAQIENLHVQAWYFLTDCSKYVYQPL